MSGLEIAGVVLGSIPLLISGLEHYSKGLSTLKNVRDYETVIQNLVTSLSTSLTIFRTSCEQLLAPLMLPDEQFRELLANPQTDAWKDNELCEKLNAKLGQAAYLSYNKAVGLLYKRIRLLKKKLDLNDSFQPKWISPNGAMDTKMGENYLKKTWRRIKIAIDADKYALLMAEIDQDITKISDLTKGNMALEPIRGERKRQANADFWTKIRDCSHRLFELLSSRFSSTCSCQHPHRANLRLDLRTNASVEQASIRFGFLFSFDENAQSVKLPWNWRHVEIEPKPETSITTPTEKQTSTHNPSSSSLLNIVDLCKILVSSPGPGSCLGFLDDQLWKYHVYIVSSNFALGENARSVPLKDLLYRGSSAHLSTKEKYSLAVTLASAVLQLHSTPWMNDSWDLSDIFFVNDVSVNTAVPELGQAYVSRSFASKPKSKDIKRQSRSFIQNEIVFALGVALLELSFGQPLLSFKTQDDLDSHGQETIFTEYSIAHRLIKNIDSRELPYFASAVTRCVRLNFDTNSTRLDDSEFMHMYYRGVVEPLQNLHTFATTK